MPPIRGPHRPALLGAAVAAVALVAVGAAAVGARAAAVGARAAAGGGRIVESAMAAPAVTASLVPPPHLERLLADSASPSGPQPERPRVFLETGYPRPARNTIRVPAGGDLQRAIDRAVPGDEILLEPGATYPGPFVLRRKRDAGPPAWIVIRTAAPDRELPAEGERITPRFADRLPKLVSQYPTEPVVSTEAGAHHYRLVGLEVTALPSASMSYVLVALGAGDALQTTLASQPYALVLDRVYVHGHPTLTFQRCIGLNSGETAIIDSWISECHGKGMDSQAIGGWNGTGPYKITNNHLEGAGENVMFGGADALIPNALPADIEIRRNHFYKPLSWRGVWTVKNLFELKAARRVLVEGNVFENNWPDAQVGFAIGMLSINQDGRSPWSVVSDVTFRYNVIRNSAHGINLVDRYSTNAQPAARLVFEHNLLERIGAASDFGGGRLFQASGIQGLTLRHNTGFGTSHGLMLYGAPIAQFVMENNAFGGDGNMAVVSADGLGFGTAALNGHAAAGWAFRGNVVVGATPSLFPSGNQFPSSIGDVGFLSPTSGDWRLRSTSRFPRVGANADSLRLYTDGVVGR